MNHRKTLLELFTKNRNKYIKPEREYEDFVTPIPVEVALEAMQQARIKAFMDVAEKFLDESEIKSLRLELDCPIGDEEYNTTNGYKGGIKFIQDKIESIPDFKEAAK